MKNNQKRMSLMIQLFAESEDDASMAGPTETGQEASEQPKTEKKEKTYSRDEVNKMLNAEKRKTEEELLKRFKAEKSEAEKLAKMDTEQKLNYELEQKTKENEELMGKLNSLTLRTEATSDANDKGLPIGYIEDWDFAKEDAESVKTKIDKLVTLRSKDLEASLNEKLKQPSPKAVDSKKAEDPYVQGFKNYFKK